MVILYHPAIYPAPSPPSPAPVIAPAPSLTPGEDKEEALPLFLSSNLPNEGEHDPLQLVILLLHLLLLLLQVKTRRPPSPLQPPQRDRTRSILYPPVCYSAPASAHTPSPAPGPAPTPSPAPDPGEDEKGLLQPYQ